MMLVTIKFLKTRFKLVKQLTQRKISTKNRHAKTKKILDLQIFSE